MDIRLTPCVPLWFSLQHEPDELSSGESTPPDVVRNNTSRASRPFPMAPVWSTAMAGSGVRRFRRVIFLPLYARARRVVGAIVETR